jgi:uncharacterized protein (TIGR00159 family)
VDLIRELFGSLTLLDIADMAAVAVLLWSGMLLLRRTRARMALIGLGILGIVYLVARQIGLKVTAGILQGFFAVLVIVVVVVFQEDLRRFFEQIASWGLRRRAPSPTPGITDLVVRAVARLASTRTGALLVFPGVDDLAPHLEGGIPLRGQLSEPLLLSVFDASSPGHDGAVVVRDSMLERFAVHLPLSTDHAQLGPGGTRHAAALGLAERTDALCVVVSEERGTVSVAHHGQLRVLRGADELPGELRTFLQEAAPGHAEPESLGRRVERIWKEAVLSIALAMSIWVVFVPGSSVTEVTRSVPVIVENLPPGPGRLPGQSREHERAHRRPAGPPRSTHLPDHDRPARAPGLPDGRALRAGPGAPLGASIRGRREQGGEVGPDAAVVMGRPSYPRRAAPSRWHRRHHR